MGKSEIVAFGFKNWELFAVDTPTQFFANSLHSKHIGALLYLFFGLMWFAITGIILSVLLTILNYEFGAGEVIPVHIGFVLVLLYGFFKQGSFFDFSVPESPWK